MKRFLGGLKPKTKLDLVGMVLMGWMALTFFIGSINIGGNSFLYTLQGILFIPLGIILKVWGLIFPYSIEGFAVVGVLIFVVTAMILIINLVCVLGSYFFYKKISFLIPIFTVLLILFVSGVNLGGSFVETQLSLNKQQKNSQRAKNISVSLDNCVKKTDTIGCQITFTDIPGDVAKGNYIAGLYFGSKKYQKFSAIELDKEANKPGMDSNYIYNELNNQFNYMEIDITNADIQGDKLTLNFTLEVPESIPTESVYLSEYTLENPAVGYGSPDFERFSSYDVELYLLRK